MFQRSCQCMLWLFGPSSIRLLQLEPLEDPCRAQAPTATKDMCMKLGADMMQLVLGLRGPVLGGPGLATSRVISAMTIFATTSTLAKS